MKIARTTCVDPATQTSDSMSYPIRDGFRFEQAIDDLMTTVILKTEL